jgi:hypothetical protein
MATSGSTNYTNNRDQMITRALRITQELGTGEAPSATRLAECALVLNDIFKEWEAYGMHLWKISTISFAMTAAVGSYNIGVGQTINQVAPLKVLQAYTRNTDSNTDSPLTLLTKQEYDAYTSKLVNGSVSQFYYNPPGAIGGTNMYGTFYCVNVPDTTFATDNTIILTAHFPLEDFDASTDVPDVPSYYYNALVWALADQLAYESAAPLAERDRITRKADYHRTLALSFDIEEGSLFFQPNWQAYG